MPTTNSSSAGLLSCIFALTLNASDPGQAILIRREGKVTIRTEGVRDLRTNHPIDAATNFRLASCTKQFTATAIMLLVRDGKLRYETRLTEIFPDLPAYARAITIRHLLTHTSGLPDYEDLMDNGPWTETKQIQDDEVLALLKKAPTPKFKPGAAFAYSNSGYVVLGAIIAKVSGHPFRDFLKTRIFHPLHMDHTLVYVEGKNTVLNRAYGHTKATTSFEQTDQSSTSATQGDGGVYSNLDDLAKWDDALTNHTLLSESEAAPSLTPVRLDNGKIPSWPDAPGDENLAPGRPVAYGFGWFLDPYHGRQRMWHYGSTRGFSTAIERFPKEHLTVIVLANRTDIDAGKLALELADANPRY